jgi:hypothetical protein
MSGVCRRYWSALSRCVPASLRALSPAALHCWRASANLLGQSARAVKPDCGIAHSVGDRKGRATGKLLRCATAIGCGRPRALQLEGQKLGENGARSDQRSPRHLKPSAERAEQRAGSTKDNRKAARAVTMMGDRSKGLAWRSNWQLVHSLRRVLVVSRSLRPVLVIRRIEPGRSRYDTAHQRSASPAALCLAAAERGQHEHGQGLNASCSTPLAACSMAASGSFGGAASEPSNTRTLRRHLQQRTPVSRDQGRSPGSCARPKDPFAFRRRASAARPTCFRAGSPPLVLQALSGSDGRPRRR